MKSCELFCSGVLPCRFTIQRASFVLSLAFVWDSFVMGRVPVTFQKCLRKKISPADLEGFAKGGDSLRFSGIVFCGLHPGSGSSSYADSQKCIPNVNSIYTIPKCWNESETAITKFTCRSCTQSRNPIS